MDKIINISTNLTLFHNNFIFNVNVFFEIRIIVLFNRQSRARLHFI